ncbi:MAG: SEC-C metal-binding domain-containing protein [Patescibacteria group bacterium]|nr:SEC-C metal-binding domain-containing protein [Patescibacteria group bacterium]
MGELNRPVPTESNPQWYDTLPDRLEEEIRLMKEFHPSFDLSHSAGESIFWTGYAKALRSDGSVITVLKIKIECPAAYPFLFPLVYDSENILFNRGCPHLSNSSGGFFTLCYGNRLDPQLDFQGSTRVKDVVNYVCIFLARQWHFERYGFWPDGQPHGELAFLYHEIKQDVLNPDDLCPCGLTEKTYRHCHMPAVLNVLNQWDLSLKGEIRKRVDQVSGRNDPCPCGSDKKFKKCCSPKLNYSSKFFLFMKFPEFFDFDLFRRDNILNALCGMKTE